MVVQEPVQAAIWQALNHYSYRDAIFLSERLYAEVGSDEALFLLATCYYRAGKPVKAYKLLESKGCPTPQCQYLMSRCCLDLNKLDECTSCLAGSIFTDGYSIDEIISRFGDSACYVLALLGNVYTKTERIAKSHEHYKRSLKLNPFLWSSFEALCDQGEKIDATRVFHMSSSNSSQILNTLNVSAACTPHTQLSTLSSTASSAVLHTPGTTHPQEHIQLHAAALSLSATPDINCSSIQCTPSIEIPTGTSTSGAYHTPDNPIPTCPPSAPKLRRAGPPSNPNVNSPAITLGTDSVNDKMLAHSLFSPLTPSFGVMPLDVTPSPGGTHKAIKDYLDLSDNHYGSTQSDNIRGNSDIIKAPQKARPNTRREKLGVKPPVFSQSGNTRDMLTPSPQYEPTLPVRRSSRLYSANSAVKENSKARATKKFATPKVPTKHNKAAQVQAMWQKQSVDNLMSLLQALGKAYMAQCQYDGVRALSLYEEISPPHYNTTWVQCQMAKVYFDMAEYKKCVEIFESLPENYHLEDMEVYSTALWHMQQDVTLSALAQRLTELDRLSVYTCCVSGNCFSLQKEHDVAVKFFQRAIQLDPNFAYAYTLLGHEYVFTEELDKAMSCFRSAVRMDNRHYNAWYGIGMIYYKQEKLVLAEIHFRKAFQINPQSSVLLCHIGVVQHALNKSKSALETLAKSIAMDPKNALCKFHRASVLFATDQHQEALKELEELKEIEPKESLIYFLIGKVHKKLGNTHLALMYFSWANDLDPKGANNKIKEALDKRYITDEDDHTAVIDVSSELESTDALQSHSPSIDADEHMMFHDHESSGESL